MNHKLKVSTPTYNEIAIKLQEGGVKLTDNDSLTLEKLSDLERPIDWRMVQVRKDCVIEAGKLVGCQNITAKEFLNYVSDIYNYILEGKMPETELEIDHG